MRYAIINNGKVENIIHLEQESADKFPNAIFCEDYPLQIGDTYKDDKFYRNDKEILTYYEQYEKDLRTLAEGMEKLDTMNDEMKAKSESRNQQLQLLEDCIVEMAEAVYAE